MALDKLVVDVVAVEKMMIALQTIPHADDMDVVLLSVCIGDATGLEVERQRSAVVSFPFELTKLISVSNRPADNLVNALQRFI